MKLRNCFERNQLPSILLLVEAEVVELLRAVVARPVFAAALGAGDDRR